MRAFDELRKLEMFFKDESRHGVSIIDLYELVQHVGNILPRLYLLCTVGSVYIKSKGAPAKDVLKDIVEMCRAVQHPIRGFFLRSYLSQGPGRAREKHEKERSELRDLVGKNLHVLGQIEGVELKMYKDIVLPRVLEQVINYKDELSQFYLMDCLIQVFSDEYHLQTLETLLGACPQLQVLPEFLQVEAFAKLSSTIGRVIEAQVDMSIVGAISLYVSLLTFTLHVHPDHLDYVDQVLGACVKAFRNYQD